MRRNGSCLRYDMRQDGDAGDRGKAENTKVTHTELLLTPPRVPFDSYEMKIEIVNRSR